MWPGWHSMCFFGIPSIVYGAFAFTIMIYLGIAHFVGGWYSGYYIADHPHFYSLHGRESHSTCQSDLLDFDLCVWVPQNWKHNNGCTPANCSGYCHCNFTIGRSRHWRCSRGYVYGPVLPDSIPTSLSQPAATLPLSVFFSTKQSPMPMFRTGLIQPH